MIKRVLIAAAIVFASPAFVSAQDIFLSFSETELVDSIAAPAGTVSGSAFVFSDGLFAFDAIDLNITSSDPSVLQFTGGTPFNTEFNILGGTAFDSSTVTADGAGNGNLFAVNVTQNGINPAVSALFNPGWREGVGANGAVLLAEVDYTIIGGGSTDLGFNLGAQGALRLPLDILDPSFGNATFTAVSDVPEPSSLALLVLGSVGLVARRKRS